MVKLPMGPDAVTLGVRGHILELSIKCPGDKTPGHFGRWERSKDNENNITKEHKGFKVQIAIEQCPACMRASSQCGMAPEQHQKPTGTGAQRARMAAILYVEEEDQFDELELALAKASGSYQEELKRSSAPVLPWLMPVNFAGAILNVRELLIPSVSFHRHELRQEPPPPPLLI